MFLTAYYREDFFSFITPHALYMAAAFFGVVSLLLVIAIFIFLAQKKRRHFTRERIGRVMDEWIGAAIIEDEFEHVHVTPDLLEDFTVSSNRQFAIDLLINTRKNLTGNAAENIRKIYEQLDLQFDSIDKSRESAWDVKAQGIYELYMMGQSHMQGEIEKYTNVSHGFVRIEAQTAMISFNGFGGLSFLGSLDHTLDEWQQLKLLEQLKLMNPEPMPEIGNWILSKNPYVALFGLRLADIFQQFQVHAEVVSTLQHENDKIRAQAITTLGRIADLTTADILVAHYPAENKINRLSTLKMLKGIAETEHLAFLATLLDDPDKDIKLNAAAAIARIGKEGKQLLQDRVASEQEDMAAIYEHVTSKAL